MHLLHTYFTTDSSIDFNSTMQVCVIPAGSNSSTVNITVIDDDIVEGDEKFIMRMHALASLAMEQLPRPLELLLIQPVHMYCKLSHSSFLYVNC